MSDEKTTVCQLAKQLCQNMDFLDYFMFSDTKEAKRNIIDECKIERLRDLDFNLAATTLFNNCFVAPFIEREKL